jgi:zinc and cadmium transporter
VRSSWLYALGSVLIVSLLSLIGLATIAVEEKKLKRIIFVMVSLATGGLFADALLDLLPESYKRSGDGAGLFVLSGILLFFVLERFLLWKHGHTLEQTGTLKTVGYMNLAADAIHNFTDGLIIGVSYLVSIPVGVSTTLAVMFHELPHELGNFFVLLYAGFPKTRALLLNFLSAVIAILGTLLALFIGSRVESFSQAVLPFAAGGFIYIAGSDLFPELHKETSVRRSLIQLLAMGAGAGVMVCLTLLE